MEGGRSPAGISKIARPTELRVVVEYRQAENGVSPLETRSRRVECRLLPDREPRIGWMGLDLEYLTRMRLSARGYLLPVFLRRYVPCSLA